MQLEITEKMTKDLAELLPPLFGGAEPDPWVLPLRDHISLDVLEVLQKAQRRGDDIRKQSFTEMLQAAGDEDPAL